MFEFDEIDLEKLIEAIDRSGLSEFSMITADGEIRISKSPGGPAPAPTQATGSGTAPSVAGAQAEASAPDARPASAPTTAAAGQESTLAPPPTLPSDAGEVQQIRTPLLGAFYRAPEPGAPPFVEIGSRVEPETTVAIIEAMKVFTSVQAGVSGVVREVLVADRDFVEHDQALFVVEVDGTGVAE